MTKRQTPARNRALGYLESLIRTSAAAGTAILPPIDTLASNAGVSRMTMWQAVRTLRDQGILRSTSSPGIIITSVPSAPPPSIPPPHRIDDSLEARIGHAIAQGTYEPGGSFPRIKELCSHYSVGYRRMHTALEHLADTGLLMRSERRYRVTSPTQSTRHTTLVFIAAIDDMTVQADATPRSVEFWRTLESGCTALGMTITVMSHNKAVRRFLSRSSSHADPPSINNRPIAGFICWSIALDVKQLVQLSAIATAALLPLALFDESGIIDMPDALIVNPRCRIYPMYGTVRSGTAMGIHLLNSGYRRIAYVGHGGGNPADRFQGVVDAYATAGMHGAVTLFSLSATQHSGEADEQVLVGRTARANRLLFDMLHQEEIPTADGDDFQLGTQNRRFINRLNLRERLTPFFDQIIQEKKFDIILGDNDIVAILALEHLQKRGISVPKEMGVAGFDDTITAIGQGLTSYNWSTSQAVHSMLQFIVRPRDFDRLFKREGVVVDVDGRVVVRGTTRVR